MAGVWRGTKGAKFMFMSSASHEHRPGGGARSGSGEGRNLIKKSVPASVFPYFFIKYKCSCEELCKQRVKDPGTQ